ncbi:hypothetical protein AYO47_00075 [Planctomyces sp. SCGC AG-212-M04]|nr:hypothetical protein AYO47_00075 [Planctomyces sp. SCGC AG-212-M04]
MDAEPENVPRWFKWYRATGFSLIAVGLIARYLGVIATVHVFWLMAVLAIGNIFFMNWLGCVPRK